MQSRVSSILNSSTIRREGESNPFFTMGETERNEFKKISHEMGVGSNQVVFQAQDAGTDVRNLVSKGEIGIMTKNVQMADMNTAT